MRSKDYIISVGGFFGGKNNREIISSVASRTNWANCLKNADKRKATMIMQMNTIFNIIWEEFLKDSNERDWFTIDFKTVGLIAAFNNQWKYYDNNKPTLNMSEYFYDKFHREHIKYSDCIRNKDLQGAKSIEQELVALAEDTLVQLALTFLEYAQKDYI